jgi:hypothetical protein
MQITFRGFALGTCLIVAVGCAGQHVTTDYSPTASFSQFRTFALVSQPDSASHQLLDDRVGQAVQTQLAAKGLTATDRGHADLFVGYGVVDHTRKEVYTTGTGWGWGGGWGWRSHRWGVAWPVDLQRSVETYTDGSVVVNLVDAKTKRVVWQGEVADALSLPAGNPGQATQRIDQAVTKMFAKYPPQPKA